MALSITKLAEKLRNKTAWQRTPLPLTQDDYENMVIYGIERLFIDTARASDYDTALIETDAQTEQTMFALDLPIDEQAYALICAEIRFF